MSIDNEKIDITVENLGVFFMLYHQQHITLKETIISFLRRKRRYEKFWALRNITFKVKKGEMLGIIGVNGSGKSTLLKILAKILIPDEGKATIRGKVSALLELGAGFHEELTGMENVYLAGSILGLTRKQIEGIYDEKTDLLSKVRSNKNELLKIEKELDKKEAEIIRTLESYKYGNVPGGKFLWPVNGFISSGFGIRIHPILRVPKFHAGIDIVAPNGTPVRAADGGEVIKAEYNSGWGYYILVYHGGGVATRYSHLSGFNASVGQRVEKGQVIGFVGSTGRSTGPHLDFEVRINGVAQNPMQYLQ